MAVPISVNSDEIISLLTKKGIDNSYRLYYF